MWFEEFADWIFIAWRKKKRYNKEERRRKYG